jgi:hypothetical protein
LQGREKLITKATITTALENNTYNNSRIKTTLNYQFISLSETVQFVCKAFLNDLKK